MPWPRGKINNSREVGGKPVIRPAEPTDLAEVIRLDIDCFGDHAWTPASWSAEFDRLTADRRILVATDTGDGGDTEVVGYVVLTVPEDARDPVDLTRVGVAPARRRTGVAGRLIAAALPAGRTVLLEVAEGNKSARELYRRHGFTEIGRRKGYYRGGGDALILQRIG
jgi:[ribosomal protein S18]-alanine N-acetyltransferase